jgi:hypothetical protein
MSIPIITEAIQRAYGKNFEHQAQQVTSRVKQYARYKGGCTGGAQTHNTLEEEEMVETTGQRLALTQISDVSGEIRNLFPRKFTSTKGKDQFDDVLLGDTVLPGSTILQAQTMAFGRTCDDVFFDGITGVNKIGANGGTSESLHADMVVAKDYVRTGTAADSNLTTAKLRYLKRQFEKNELYGQDQKANGAKLCCAINADMKDELLSDTLISDHDKTKLNKLDDGDVVYWLGIHFVRSERLPVDASNADVKDAVMWVSNLVQFDEWAKSVHRISERSDRSYGIQYFVEKMIGAARLEQKAVGTIACDTSIFS